MHSMGRATQLAGLSISDFIELCGTLRVPVLWVPPADMESDLGGFEKWRGREEQIEPAHD